VIENRNIEREGFIAANSTSSPFGRNDLGNHMDAKSGNMMRGVKREIEIKRD